MDKTQCNTASSCCGKHGSMICGVILLVIASILTLITLNGLAIFGMFLVGIVMTCHKHLRSSCDNSDPCCDSDQVACDKPSHKSKASK